MRYRFWILLIALPFLLSAKGLEPFVVTGVEGKLLANIQARLQELNERQPLAKEPVETLKNYIQQAIYPFGYFKASIKIIKKENQPLQILIIPGPPLLIHQLTISITGEGKEDPGLQALIHQLPIQKGQPFNSILYDNAKQTLIDTAQQFGYLHATFDKSEVLIDRARYTSSITLEFNTSLKYYFGQVRFDPTFISPELLKRYIPFQAGQAYSTNDILLFTNNLNGSGYFSQVTVTPKASDNLVIPIEVSLKPAPRINYTLGIGYGTDTGLRGRAGLNITPINPSGHKFNAFALGSFKENALQGQYIIPGNQPTIDQYELTGGYSNLSYNSGNSSAFSLSLAERHTLSNYQSVISINNLYEEFRYTNEPRINNFSLYPKASFTWHNKSDKLFSPNGYKLTLNGLAANEAFLSNINFKQASVDAKAAMTFDPIRTRLYLHGIQGITEIDNINKLPLSIALLLGGSDNLKGYSYNSIGPGKVLSYGGIEIQKETKEHWYVVGFYDIGDVYDPDVKSLKRDVGLGLMWVSPIGPIKIGVAQPVSNHFQRQHNTQPRLVVSMGPDL